MNSCVTPEPGAALVCAAAVLGADGHLVEVRAEYGGALPTFSVTGLPDVATRETRDRIRAAVVNSSLPWPSSAITVSLLPADLARLGAGFDLAIAIAVLIASGAIPAATADGCVFVAELGLDGVLRPVPGVLPGLLAAARAGCTRAVVAEPTAAEAVMTPGLAVVPCRSLRDVVGWLTGVSASRRPVDSGAGAEPEAAVVAARGVRLGALTVAPVMRLALETSAAGGHHLCLAGPRGSTIPELAATVAALLPPLVGPESLEVSAVHSVAGLLGPGHALVTRPPFRAPHRTATAAAVAGGGRGMTRPGEAALAHRGVLFLEDAPEFGRDILAVLRQPLADGTITIARSGRVVRFPARFTLVAGMTPCPCGGGASCSCTPIQKRRYRARLADLLGLYLAIHLSLVSPAPGTSLRRDPAGAPDDSAVARVAEARDRARRRLRDTPWQVNGDIPGSDLGRFFLPDAEAIAPVSRAVDLGEISTRAAHQVIRVAWTLADLDRRDRPTPQDLGQALAFYLGVAK